MNKAGAPQESPLEGTAVPDRHFKLIVHHTPGSGGSVGRPPKKKSESIPHGPRGLSLRSVDGFERKPFPSNLKRVDKVNQVLAKRQMMYFFYRLNKQEVRLECDYSRESLLYLSVGRLHNPSTFG